MKKILPILAIHFPHVLIFLYSSELLSQNHRYDRYDDPGSIGVGIKVLLVGGVIWGIGMAIILMHKKDEKGVVTSNAWTANLGGTLAAIGGIIAAFGLISLGF